MFAGRERDVERFAMLLDRQDSRVLVLHGESGIGKSSFLRAGVIPYLEDECLGYQFMREPTQQDALDTIENGSDEGMVIFIRATNAPIVQMSQALCIYCAKPLRYLTPT